MSNIKLIVEVKEQEFHEFKHIKCLTESLDNLFLCFLTIRELREKTLSEGTDVADTEKKSRAIFERLGNVFSFDSHHFSMSVLFGARF